MAKKFKTYKQLQKWAKSVGITTSREWFDWMKDKDNERPADVPYHPSKAYSEWSSWGDFFGVKDRKAISQGKVVPYEKAKKVIANKKIFSSKEYVAFVKANLKLNLPKNPPYHYKGKWKGWGEFLPDRFLSFDKALPIIADAEWVKTYKGWYEYATSGKKPDNIPSDIFRHYGFNLPELMAKIRQK